MGSKKVRVYDLAKELKVDNKRAIEECRQEGLDISVPSNLVPDDVAERIRNKYYPKKAVTAAERRLVESFTATTAVERDSDIDADAALAGSLVRRIEPFQGEAPVDTDAALAGSRVRRIEPFQGEEPDDADAALAGSRVRRIEPFQGEVADDAANASQPAAAEPKPPQPRDRILKASSTRAQEAEEGKPESDATHHEEPHSDLPPGFVLQERYQVMKRLGAGGFGDIYLATRLRIRQKVALKRLKAAVASDEVRMQFDKEASLLFGLSHSGLPKVVDLFSHEAGEFIVMEYIEGKDLFELLKEQAEPFSVTDVLTWADQLLGILEYLHSRRPPVIHRDIKPQNIKLAPDGRIVLLDFGLAKGASGLMQSGSSLLSADGGPESQSIAAYTMGFAPLEQVSMLKTDERSDLYSLGATLYAILTGVVPEHAMFRVASTTTGRQDPLISIHIRNPTVPEAVARTIHWALSIHPEDRPASAVELRTALSHALAVSANGMSGAVSEAQWEYLATNPTILEKDIGPTLIAGVSQAAPSGAQESVETLSSSCDTSPSPQFTYSDRDVKRAIPIPSDARDRGLSHGHRRPVSPAADVTNDAPESASSRIAVDQRSQIASDTLRDLEEGIIVEGWVANLTDDGATIDLGGINAYLRSSDMSWTVTNRPDDEFSVGDRIQVKVLEFDRHNNELVVGYKQLLPEPWDAVADRYCVGQRLQGAVASLEDYGAFVTLEGGDVGFVPVEDMSVSSWWTHGVTHPSGCLRPGQTVRVIVRDIDSSERLILVSIMGIPA